MVAAKAHYLSGFAIQYMEEIATRRPHNHLKSDYRFRSANQAVEFCGSEQGALMQAINNVAAGLNAWVHVRLQGVNRISQMPGTGDQTQPTRLAWHLLMRSL